RDEHSYTREHAGDDADQKNRKKGSRCGWLSRCVHGVWAPIGSSGSHAIVSFAWIRKLVTIRSAMCHRALIEILHEGFREKDIQRPIDRHTHFFFRARQFAPVNTAPEKPCDKSGKIHAKDPRHTSTATDRCELSKRFEFERFFGLPSTLAMMLCARTLPSRDACCAVGGQKSPIAGSGTSAQSPSAQRPSWPLDLEMRIHFDSTAFLGTRDKIQDWVW